MRPPSGNPSDELLTIPVERFQPLRGTIHFSRAEEGGNVGIDIPLAPFDSGLPWEQQPIEPTIVLALYLPVNSLSELDTREFSATADNSDSSVYIGSAHNPIGVPSITFRRISDRVYVAVARLAIDFALEGVGQPEVVTIQAELDVR